MRSRTRRPRRTRAPRWLVAGLALSVAAVLPPSAVAQEVDPVPPLSAPIPATIRVEPTTTEQFFINFMWWSNCTTKVTASFDVEEYGVRNDAGAYEVYDDWRYPVRFEDEVNQARVFRTLEAQPGQPLELESVGAAYPDPARTGIPPADDPTHPCQPANIAAFRAEAAAADRHQLWTVDARPLRAEVAVEVGEEGPEVGEPVAVSLRLENAGPSPVTAFAPLDEIGLDLDPAQFELVSGPTPAAPATLAPGAVVDLGYVVRPKTAGRLTVTGGGAGTYEGAPVDASASVDLDIDPPIDVIVESWQVASTGLGDEFDAAVTIRNRWDKPVDRVKVDALVGEDAGSLGIVSGPIGPDGQEPPADGYELAGGASIRLTYRVRLQEAVYPLEVQARISGREPVSDLLFFLTGRSVPRGGLEVGVEAEREGSKLIVTTTVENASGEPVEDLATTGVVVEQVTAAGGGGLLPSPVSGVQAASELPATLGVGATAEVVSELDIVGLGVAVLTETVNGSTPGGEVAGDAVVSIEVTERDVERIDAERMAEDGLRTTLRTLSDTNQQIMDGFTTEMSGVTGVPVDPGVQADIDDYKAIGFSDHWAEKLAVWKAERETFGLRWEAGYEEFKEVSGQRGVALEQSVLGFLDTVSDWDKVDAIAHGLASSGLENLGYLGDVTSMSGPELLAVAGPANRALAAKVQQDVALTWQGQREIWGLERSAFLADPRAQTRVVGKRWGGYAGNATFDTAVGITTEVASAGTSKLAGALGRELLGEGLEAGMSSGRGPRGSGAATGAVDPVSDASARLTRLEQAERANLRNVPKGTVLPLDASFSARTGMSIDDAEFFQGVVAEMRAKYPEVDFVAAFRTAEPSSITLADVIGKEEWNTFKAIGALDEAIGGPSSLAGQASVFKPVKLSSDALYSLDAANPGFAKRYVERYDTQLANWNEYTAGTSKMNKIVKGSLANAERGGIRIINDRPGHQTHGVTYLEQLDDPAFVDSLGLAPGRLDVIRAELESHPGLTPRVNVVAQPKDGAIGFAIKVSDTKTAPIGSDFDLQYFGPADGIWPDGLKGQIITDFMARVAKNPRVPAHGASDVGFDMSSGALKKLAEFEMLPYHPAAAGPKADELLGRMARTAADLRGRADKIELEAVTSPDPRRARELLRQVDDLRKQADGIAGVTREQLLGWAKGEKLVRITPGDIRVDGEYP